MLTAIVVALFLCIILMDFLPMGKAPLKEKIIYLLLTAVSFGILLLYSLDVPLPSPSDGIRNLIDAIFPM
jgi:hypothetical protein